MAKLRTLIRSLVVTVLCFMIISVAVGQYLREGSRPQDLKAVAVSIQVDGLEEAGDEITSRELQPQVEAWLKQDGFKALTLEEWAKSASSPILEIKMFGYKEHAYSYRVVIHAEMRERVVLLGPSARTDWAVTWLYGPRLTSGHATKLRDDIREIITRFTGSNFRRLDSSKSKEGSTQR